MCPAVGKRCGGSGGIVRWDPRQEILWGFLQEGMGEASPHPLGSGWARWNHFSGLWGAGTVLSLVPAPGEIRVEESWSGL